MTENDNFQKKATEALDQAEQFASPEETQRAIHDRVQREQGHTEQAAIDYREKIHTEITKPRFLAADKSLQRDSLSSLLDDETFTLAEAVKARFRGTFAGIIPDEHIKYVEKRIYEPGGLYEIFGDNLLTVQGKKYHAQPQLFLKSWGPYCQALADVLYSLRLIDENIKNRNSLPAAIEAVIICDLADQKLDGRIVWKGSEYQLHCFHPYSGMTYEEISNYFQTPDGGRFSVGGIKAKRSGKKQFPHEDFQRVRSEILKNRANVNGM